MEKRNCGHCNFQGDLKQKRVLCLFDNEWHDVNYSCEQWIEYSSSMPRHERLEWAKGIRARYDSEKREDEDKRFQRERDWEDKEFQKERDKKSRRFQVLLFIWGWISGIITILITQWILSLFNLK